MARASRITDQVMADAVEAYLAGYSTSVVGAALGLSSSSVSLYVAKAGHKARPAGRVKGAPALPPIAEWLVTRNIPAKPFNEVEDLTPHGEWVVVDGVQRFAPHPKHPPRARAADWLRLAANLARSRGMTEDEIAVAVAVPHQDTKEEG